jgi:hypothetical protein
LKGNILTVGSPISNEYAYAVFDNELVRGNLSYMRQSQRHPLTLPVRNLLSGKDVEDKNRVVRRGKFTEPNWGVIVEGKAVFPEIDIDGRLKTDYLLLTKVPNFFDQNWSSNGNALLSMGGVHGPGTQGFALLLSDHAATEKLNTRLKALGSPYWQVLIKIIQVEREDNRDIAKSIDIKDICVFPVDIQEGRLRKVAKDYWCQRLHAARLLHDLS